MRTSRASFDNAPALLKFILSKLGDGSKVTVSLKSKSDVQETHDVIKSD
jgi:hypothetical protein